MMKVYTMQLRVSVAAETAEQARELMAAEVNHELGYQWEPYTEGKETGYEVFCVECGMPALDNGDPECDCEPTEPGDWAEPDAYVAELMAQIQ